MTTQAEAIECWSDDGRSLQARVRLMGGTGEWQVIAPDAALRSRAAVAAVREVRRIEAAWSRYRPESLVSRINAAAGSGKAIRVDAETASMLEFGAALHAASAGRFDLTSGVLRRAWDFRRAQLPDPAVLDAARRRVGWQRVHWDGQQVLLPEAGMELDLGGIGKEYACDRAAAILVEQGASGGWVNLAGDLRAIGPPAKGGSWAFGIRHPRDTKSTLATVEMAAGALATSGDYERYFELGGRRYAHILDATTGWPVHDWQSISVSAPVCAAAGAACTVAMLQGRGALAWLRGQGLSFLAVDAQGRMTQETAREPGEAGPASRVAA
jgi:FAD:protein FMN transferase